MTVALAACRSDAQVTVFDNQSNFGFFLAGFSEPVTLWDDLQLTDGGLLSEVSFLADPPVGQGNAASGFIDLRVFDETFNRPQGDPLAVIPFDDAFQTTIVDGISLLNIELTGLESLGVNLPSTGRIGAGIRLDGNDWFFPDAGSPEIGSSPGGNWLDNSSFERTDLSGDFPWRVAVVDPAPVGPGVGGYNLFQTALATPDHPSSNGGAGVSGDFFTGVGFNVERTTHISEVGAYLRSAQGTLFAAIVEANNVFSQLSGDDFTEENVLGHALLDPPDGSEGADVTAPLELTLEPGAYFLMLGSDRFGASGSALLRDSHIPLGDWPTRAVRTSDDLNITQIGAHRLFVNADSAPGTVQARPTHDVLAEVMFDPISDEVTGVRLIDGEDDINVNGSTTSDDTAEYALFEFSLHDVPLDRDIRSVSLELDVGLAAIGLEVEAYGYVGDGVATPQDAAGLFDVIGTLTLDGSGATTIDLDPAYVKSLVDAGQDLGVTLIPTNSGSFAIRTLEGGPFAEPALLTIALGPEDQAIPGDFDGDGDVDVDDFGVFANSFLLSPEGGPPFAAGDFDEDGDVDVDDFGVFANSFLLFPPPASTVPEPSTLSLALAAALGFRRGRR